MKKYVVVSCNNIVICVLEEHFKKSALLRAVQEYFDVDDIVLTRDTSFGYEVIYNLTSISNSRFDSRIHLVEAHLYT